MGECHRVEAIAGDDGTGELDKAFIVCFLVFLVSLGYYINRQQQKKDKTYDRVYFHALLKTLFIRDTKESGKINA